MLLFPPVFWSDEDACKCPIPFGKFEPIGGALVSALPGDGEPKVRRLLKRPHFFLPIVGVRLCDCGVVSAVEGILCEKGSLKLCFSYGFDLTALEEDKMPSNESNMPLVAGCTSSLMIRRQRLGAGEQGAEDGKAKCWASASCLV